jgi:hypothetical protein
LNLAIEETDLAIELLSLLSRSDVGECQLSGEFPDPALFPGYFPIED